MSLWVIFHFLMNPSLRLWDFFQLPSENVTQEVLTPGPPLNPGQPPPQARRPIWEWWSLFPGRSGRAHSQVPLGYSSSADFLCAPPVTITRESETEKDSGFSIS